MNKGFLVVIDADSELATVNIEKIREILYYKSEQERHLRIYMEGGCFITCHKTVTMESVINRLYDSCNVGVVDAAKLILEKK